ncbi:hypothetical protein GTY65_08630 [Streptomyces sp. SID8379]|uniref:hypothetical protein n=1 Tax=unclassified Streptomyces TaxID=2593676 RepID=UPI000369F81C|nr:MULTISPECIES: hypothetical protein [unclassified Streptomyces]MYW64138.1 hypothetical protein [Streptomyces sp. SID8379]
MFRTAVLACALTLVAMFASGCMGRIGYCGPEGPTPAGITAADLVGTWHGDPSGELVLRPGAFTADTGWPDSIDLDDSSRDDRTGAVTGAWSLVPDLDNADENGVDLELSLTGSLYDYDISGSRSAPVLYAYTTDPDLCEFHTFRR